MILHYYNFPRKIYFKLNKDFCQKIKNEIITNYSLRKLYRDIKRDKGLQRNCRSFIRFFQVNLFPLEVLRYLEEKFGYQIENQILGYRNRSGYSTFIQSNFPLYLDERFYYVVGCLFGDGCWREFMNTNQKLLGNFRRCIKVFGEFKISKLILQKGKYRRIGDRIINVRRKCYWQVLPCAIPQIIENSGVNLRKRIFPSEFLSSLNKSELTALFIGLFNTEGSVNISGITIGNTNKNLVEFLKQIAKKLALRYAVFPNKQYNSLIFYIPKSNVRKLLKYIRDVLKRFREIEVVEEKFKIMKKMDYYKKIEIFLLKVMRKELDIKQAMYKWQDQYYQALTRNYISIHDKNLSITHFGIRHLKNKGVL